MLELSRATSLLCYITLGRYPDTVLKTGLLTAFEQSTQKKHQKWAF